MNEEERLLGKFPFGKFWHKDKLKYFNAGWGLSLG